jgi:hypothetical protein
VSELFPGLTLSSPRPGLCGGCRVTGTPAAEVFFRLGDWNDYFKKVGDAMKLAVTLGFIVVELIFREDQLLKAYPAGISVRMILNFRSEF